MSKNGPNKTVAAFRRKFGRNQAAVDAVRERMSAPSPMKDVMDKVSRGEMTAEEGAEAVRQMMERR